MTVSHDITCLLCNASFPSGKNPALTIHDHAVTMHSQDIQTSTTPQKKCYCGTLPIIQHRDRLPEINTRFNETFGVLSSATIDTKWAQDPTSYFSISIAESKDYRAPDERIQPYKLPNVNGTQEDQDARKLENNRRQEALDEWYQKIWFYADITVKFVNTKDGSESSFTERGTDAITYNHTHDRKNVALNARIDTLIAKIVVSDRKLDEYGYLKAIETHMALTCRMCESVISINAGESRGDIMAAHAVDVHHYKRLAVPA